MDISDVGITAMASGGHVVANEVRTIAKEHAAATENMVTHPNDDTIFREDNCRRYSAFCCVRLG
jgi:hypothetical protein